jgi:FixJ family two-component response regulator
VGWEDFLEKGASQKKLIEGVKRTLDRDVRARFDALSPRELEVLFRVVQGKLNEQIGADLGIHERTVKLHRTAVTTKLGVQSVAELRWLTLEAAIFSASTAILPEEVTPTLTRNSRTREEQARQSELHARFDVLSQRELEVFSRVAQGKHNKQISADLGIHERTVRLHRTAVTTKLGVQSVAELRRLALEAGILTASAAFSPKANIRR